MQVETIITPDYIRHDVSGKLDSLSAPDFEETVVNRTQEHPADTIFQLKGLSYISSSGLRVFLELAKLARTNNTRVVLSTLQPQVLEIFDMAGFTQFFTIADSVEDAVAILRRN
ncbi:MAG: STAS domain-containing protein [Acidobacteria bacterium]|nr:STAS domain-containing protein [Acidobacteriota bacterium]